jgi:hypothetical protein
VSEERKIELGSYDCSLDSEGNIDLPREELRKLNKKGFTRVTVKIQGSSKELLGESNIDPSLFEEIIEVQSLPEYVVFELLTAKGSIKRDNFCEGSV